MPTLHIVDANCSWIRGLAGGLPHGWSVRNYLVYSPQWLSNVSSDLKRSFRSIRKDNRTEEILVIVPGWNRAPRISATILKLFMRPSLGRQAGSSAVLFTFPFYSSVAGWLKGALPEVPIAYHAHDPFEFYAYPPGYIRKHEDILVPMCDRVFVIADKLRQDFLERYPNVEPEILGNAVSASFLHEVKSGSPPREMRRILAKGRPVVGCVGQINQTYDWELLDRAFVGNPGTHFVFIGNLFEEGDMTDRIRVFFRRDNVHWLGPKPHHELKRYMESCDILLNPLAVNAQNDRRDTLRLYDYLSTEAAVVSTAVDGAKRHGNLVRAISNESEMIAALSRMPPPLSVDEIAQRRAYLAENTWEARGRQLAQAMLPSKR